MRSMRSICVEGLNTERFIRAAGERQISLYDLRRKGRRNLTAMAKASDLPALQEMALAGGWTLTLGSWNRLRRWMDWARRRWILCTAALAALALILLASQVVWGIDVQDAGAYEADVRSALEELGFRMPMLRRSMDLGQLRDALEWRYPRVAWVECGFRGVTLVVRMVEGVLPQLEQRSGSCDIVALRDGVVHTIVTRVGTPVVKQGDIVRAGDVLIKGEERTSDGGVRPVAARGSVTARVWQGASVRLPATETITTYTGQVQQVWTIRTPWFDLWPLPDSPFVQQDVAVRTMPFGGFLFPLVLHAETRMEADCTVQYRDAAEIRAEGWEAAVRRLREIVGPDESLIDIWGNCSMIDDESVLSVAIGEMLVEIGTRSDSGMAAPLEPDQAENAGSG